MGLQDVLKNDHSGNVDAISDQQRGCAFGRDAIYQN